MYFPQCVCPESNSNILQLWMVSTTPWGKNWGWLMLGLPLWYSYLQVSLSGFFLGGGRTKTYAILWGMNMRKSQLSFGVHQGVPHGWNLSQHVPLRSGERWRFDEVFGPRASNWDLYERSVGGPGCGVRGVTLNGIARYGRAARHCFACMQR